MFYILIRSIFNYISLIRERCPILINYLANEYFNYKFARPLADWPNDAMRSSILLDSPVWTKPLGAPVNRVLFTSAYSLEVSESLKF